MIFDVSTFSNSDYLLLGIFICLLYIAGFFTALTIMKIFRGM